MQFREFVGALKIDECVVEILDVVEILPDGKAQMNLAARRQPLSRDSLGF